MILDGASRIAVVAAVIEHGGRFLVTRRQDGVHLAGHWEFPGGKIGAGETHPDALRREILEELDTDVVVNELLLETTHSYPERTVTLFFYRCDLLGTPQPMLGQEMEWIPRAQLSSLRFPPADEELIRLLGTGPA
jgi:mutator protein MutT